MNRRITDNHLYRDFRDLAWIVILADSVAVIVIVTIWQIAKSCIHSRW